MKIRRIIDGKNVEIKLTDGEIAMARMESERISTRLLIKSKLKGMFDEGRISEDVAFQDEDLIAKIVEDVIFNIGYFDMSESKAAEAAIEKWVDLENDEDEQEEK